MKVSERIVWVDYAKSILIYLMVVCHCGTLEGIAQIVYAFHMPAFFIVSGYLFRPHKWYSSLKSFLIPLVFYSSINFIIYVIPKAMRGQFDSSYLFERAVMPFFYMKSTNIPEDMETITLFVGSWFIITLLCCRLLAGDISQLKSVSKYPLFFIVFLLVYLTMEQFLPIKTSLVDSKLYRILPSLPFFLIGGVIRRSLDFSQIRWPIICLMAVVFVIIAFSQGKCDILYLKYGICYPLFYFNAVLGSIVFFWILSFLPRSRFVEIISSGTFLILGCHIFLRNWIGAFMSKVQISISHDYYALVVGAIIIMICFFPIKILLRRSPILLGK